MEGECSGVWEGRGEEQDIDTGIRGEGVCMGLKVTVYGQFGLCCSEGMKA